MNDPVRNRHDRKMAQTRLPRCGTSLLKTDANGPVPILVGRKMAPLSFRIAAIRAPSSILPY